MAPCFFSCDGSGTSRRIPPVTGNLEASFEVVAGVTEVAAFDAEDEIDAAGAARINEKGTVVDAIQLSM
jgi:hypothetical protein